VVVEVREAELGKQQKMEALAAAARGRRVLEQEFLGKETGVEMGFRRIQTLVVAAAERAL
jgi:hypothetical protein